VRLAETREARTPEFEEIFDVEFTNADTGGQCAIIRHKESGLNDSVTLKEVQGGNGIMDSEATAKLWKKQVWRTMRRLWRRVQRRERRSREKHARA